MKKLLTILISIAMICAIAIPSTSLGSTQSSSKKISIIFTGDMHSHMDSVKTVKNGKAVQYGGFARVSTAVNDIEKDFPDSFLLDAGNFSMGTAYQTIYKSSASELRTMGKMGYDAVNIGSNEFAFGASGLAKMLKKASASVGTTSETTRKYNQQTGAYETTTTITKKMPDVVSSNIDWTDSLNSSKTDKDARKLKSAYNKYGVEDYTIINKNGIKAAVFGLDGSSAIKDMDDPGVKFSSYTSRAKEIVKEIKRNGEADMIICLCSGDLKDGKGDEADLAKKVPDIDVIVGSGSGVGTEEPVTEGDTVIVSADKDSTSMGHLVLKKDGDSYKTDDYDLIKLDKSVKQNGSTESTVEGYTSDINANYFGHYGFSYNETAGRSKFNFADSTTAAKSSEEEPLCDLIADSYIYSAKKASKKTRIKADVSILSPSTVTGTLTKGSITPSDIYNVCSLGIGPDGRSGYPLVSFYLTGKELKNTAEANVSLSGSDKLMKFAFGGMQYGYNKHRLYMNRALDVKIKSGSNKYSAISNDKLYKVVADEYTYSRLAAIKDNSHGLLSAEPKDSSGNKIKAGSMKGIILYKNGREVKQWYALAKYFGTFSNNSVPSHYRTADGRMSNETSWNPVSILKQPNNLTFIVLAVVLIPVVIIIGFVVWLVSRKRRKRGYGKTMFSGKTGRARKENKGGQKIRTRRYKSKFK